MDQCALAPTNAQAAHQSNGPGAASKQQQRILCVSLLDECRSSKPLPQRPSYVQHPTQHEASIASMLPAHPATNARQESLGKFGRARRIYKGKRRQKGRRYWSRRSTATRRARRANTKKRRAIIDHHLYVCGGLRARARGKKAKGAGGRPMSRWRFFFRQAKHSERHRGLGPTSTSVMNPTEHLTSECRRYYHGYQSVVLLGVFFACSVGPNPQSRREGRPKSPSCSCCRAFFAPNVFGYPY